MSLIPAPPPPDADADADNSTIYTAATPPESDATGLDDEDDDNAPTISPVPHPGHTFLIRAVSSGAVITLIGGRIVLTPQPDGRGSHWECFEEGECLGFRNAVSAQYLGRDSNLALCCSALAWRLWEKFRVGERAWGSALLMDHWWSWRPVGMRVENGVGRLTVIANGEVAEVVWEFVRV